MVGRTAIWPPSSFRLTLSGSERASVPLGPLISMDRSLTVAVTPLGMGIGFLPVRDCRTFSVVEASGACACIVMGSPHLAKQLAADALPARFTIRHHPTARAQYRDPHPGADAIDAVVTHIDATARRRYPPQAIDGRLAIAPVAKHERKHLRLLLALARPHVVEIPLRPHDGGDVFLELGVRHLHAIVASESPVANAGEHVCDRIGHHEITSLP